MNNNIQRGIEPVPVDEIRGKSVEEVVKYLGWEPLKEFDNGEVFYQNHTPNGENIYLFNLHKETLAEDIVEEVSYKSEKDLYREWVGFRNNGMKGIPERNEDIAADAKVAVQMFQQLSDAMKVVQYLQQQEPVTDITVKFAECEYDDENDILTTRGTMTFKGKQYDIAFKEQDGAPTIEITCGEDFVICGQRGGSIEEVYTKDVNAGKTMIAHLDEVFQKAAEKASAYQRTEADGRLAYLNYEASQLTPDDIAVYDVQKNTGDIGDLIGKIRVDNETLRFTADRDGSIMQLGLVNEPLAAPYAMKMTNDLVDLVYNAIEESIHEYTRNEEKVTDMNEFEVNFDSCEYDAETDTMTTTGKASFNGKEFDAFFTERDGRAPVILLDNDNVGMGYANGDTVYEYDLYTEEGQALYHSADAIYRTMFEKADEFQHRDPDAICARISYENKDIEEADIEVISIDRNKGDIGELVGFVSINDDTLRFLADRDGNIMSLMPKGTPMQDVNTVPIADEVKCIICDAIHDGILEYNREAEIVSNAIAKEAEERGWAVRKFENGEMLLTNSTYGGGLLINAREDTLAQDIKDYADNFDVDQTMDMWRSARNKGVQGIPELNKDLEREAKEARDMCVELSDAAAEVEASIDDREIESERQTDDYER